MSAALGFSAGMGFMLLLVIVREEIEERQRRKVRKFVESEIRRLDHNGGNE